MVKLFRSNKLWRNWWNKWKMELKRKKILEYSRPKRWENEREWRNKGERALNLLLFCTSFVYGNFSLSRRHKRPFTPQQCDDVNWMVNCFSSRAAYQALLHFWWNENREISFHFAFIPFISFWHFNCFQLKKEKRKRPFKCGKFNI